MSADDGNPAGCLANEAAGAQTAPNPGGSCNPIQTSFFLPHFFQKALSGSFSS
jgi:hypothetical protein